MKNLVVIVSVVFFTLSGNDVFSQRRPPAPPHAPHHIVKKKYVKHPKSKKYYAKSRYHRAPAVRRPSVARHHPPLPPRPRHLPLPPLQPRP